MEKHQSLGLMDDIQMSSINLLFLCCFFRPLHGIGAYNENPHPLFFRARTHDTRLYGNQPYEAAVRTITRHKINTQAHAHTVAVLLSFTCDALR